jgi:Rad3-related DNA helicase
LAGTATYLVHSRMLQTQLSGDFPEVPILWGRGNYVCIRGGRRLNASTSESLRSSSLDSLRQDSGSMGVSLIQGSDGGVVVMCDACTHGQGNKCEEYKQCVYVEAKERALESAIRVLNYDYFLTEANYVGKFSHNDIVIVDEADSLEDTLVNHIKVELTDGMMRRLHIGRPRFKTAEAKGGLSSWKDWASITLEQVRKEFVSAEREVKGYGWVRSQEQVDNIKRMERTRAMMRRLEMFTKYVDDTWIYEESDHPVYGSYIRFRPVWISEAMAEAFMWRHGEKFVLMSATFHRPHVLAKLLGIPLKEIEFHSFPSTFPVDSRQVDVNPVANLTFKTMDEEVPKLIEEIKRILALHPDEKGLIHCVSYGLAKKIMAIGNPRLITHNGGDKIDMVDVFKKSSHPMVLVSPSSERGISLDDDHCRFIIWAKAPFLNLKDKLVQSRIYGDKSVGQAWYLSHMLLSVVQGCGRGTRSRKDYCKSYVLDQQIANAMTRNPGMLPKWFGDACW